MATAGVSTGRRLQLRPLIGAGALAGAAVGGALGLGFALAGFSPYLVTSEGAGIALLFVGVSALIGSAAGALAGLASAGALRWAQLSRGRAHPVSAGLLATVVAYLVLTWALVLVLVVLPSGGWSGWQEIVLLFSPYALAGAVGFGGATCELMRRRSRT